MIVLGLTRLITFSSFFFCHSRPRLREGRLQRESRALYRNLDSRFRGNDTNKRVSPMFVDINRLVADLRGNHFYYTTLTIL